MFKLTYAWFMLQMTYDYAGSWQSSTGFNAPLYRSGSIYSVDETVKYWVSRIGSNTNKLLLGIALYGPTWTLTSGNTGIGAPGKPGQPMKYSEICKNIKNGWTRVFDKNQRVPYAYGNKKWVGYDDAQSIQEKINYLKNKKLGGAFVWEMSMDDSSKYLIKTLFLKKYYF
jgi:GH18 family chitinase